jgi:two-component system phosphate regulon response regulator PhoB
MKKILLIDDERDILEVTAHILTLEGFWVKTHLSGLHVLEIVQQYKPNLILLDVRLPGKLGTEVCKDIKAIYPHLPVLFFSAHAKEQEVAECDADGLIEKPFEIKHLINTIKQHVN